MKTEDLITSLSGTPAAAPFAPVKLAAGMAAFVLAPVALFLGIFGTRPGLALALTNPVVPFKTAIPLLVCLTSAALALRLARPEARPGRLPYLYLIPGSIALALWIGAFALLPATARFAEVTAAGLAECLGSIPLLSILPAIAALRLLRRGASTVPALSATLAGLMAASGAAAGYSLFCTRDNPLFFITWYGVAIVIVTAATRHFGRRMLVW